MAVTPEKRERMRATLKAALSVIDELSVTTACKHCEMFTDGYCQQWQSAVPTDVQPKGCDQFMERIPF